MEQTILNNFFTEHTIEILINPETYSDSKNVISIINCIEKTMMHYANVITYTQMRNIYSVLQKANTVIEIQKARPKIAYIHARLEKDSPKDITFFIMDIIRKIENDNQIKPFHDLMETMVAFHKQYNTTNH